MYTKTANAYKFLNSFWTEEVTFTSCQWAILDQEPFFISFYEDDIWPFLLISPPILCYDIHRF
jgi:hypothetical protein